MDCRTFSISYGLGVGLGTSRTSSFPVALLSNVGLPGMIFYLLFAAMAFLRRRGCPAHIFTLTSAWRRAMAA